MDACMHTCTFIHRSCFGSSQQVCFVIFSIVDFDHISCLWVYENACCQIKFVCFNFHNVTLCHWIWKLHGISNLPHFLHVILYICMCVNEHHM
jgi:hypothetical protein